MRIRYRITDRSILDLIYYLQAMIIVFILYFIFRTIEWIASNKVTNEDLIHLRNIIVSFSY